jgi:hypothetical protein
MTTHFSIAPGMETVAICGLDGPFLFFPFPFLTLMGWLSELIIAQKMVMVRYNMVGWISLARSFTYCTP